MTIRRAIGVTLSIFCVCTFMYSCKDEPTNTSIKQQVISFKKEGTLQLINTATNAVIATLDIEIADTEYETQTGLMYRDVLKPKQAMLFVFPNEDFRSFYMKNTKLPLDIIYIGDNKKIVSIQKDAQPFNEQSLPSEGPAKYVLEVNAGLSELWQLKAGDSIEFSSL